MLIELSNVSKRFGRDTLFSPLTYRFESPGHYAILGSNGSGKSTLLKMLSGYVRPTTGKITYALGNRLVENQHLPNEISFSSPYITLPDELRLEELVSLHFSLRSSIASVSPLAVLDHVGLAGHLRQYMGHLSSGMLQRVKLALAFATSGSLLLLDEPVANLDPTGSSLFSEWLRTYSLNRLVIIASNHQEAEINSCNNLLTLGPF
jgi:ABC-type multidrug transport system ATPase subunit